MSELDAIRGRIMMREALARVGGDQPTRAEIDTAYLLTEVERLRDALLDLVERYEVPDKTLSGAVVAREIIAAIEGETE